MVILGGLELVAAGYILNELKNDKKEREREREREREKERRDRKRDHKHHNQHESPSRMRPQQNLYPPQAPPPRPHSAPPPGHAPPTWQPQPVPYPPQHWQPQQQRIPSPQPPPQPPPQPQGYLDLKTGKVQQNMYPPDHPLARSMMTAQQQGQHHAADYNRSRGEFDSDVYGGPPPYPSITAQQSNNQAHPQANTFSSSRPG